MLSDLYNAPCPPEKAVGAACIGSSEAIMLAGEGGSQQPPGHRMTLRFHIVTIKAPRMNNVQFHRVTVSVDSVTLGLVPPSNCVGMCCLAARCVGWHRFAGNA